MVLPISYAPQEQSIMGNLGTGLGQGLQALANMKLDQYKRQQQSKYYNQLLTGSPEQQAEALPFVDPAFAREFYKQKEQEKYALGAQELLAGLMGNPNQSEKPTQDQVIEQLLARPEGFSPKEMEDALSIKAQPTQPTPLKGKVKPETALRYAEQIRQKQQFETTEVRKRQEHIDKINKPDIKDIESRGVPARKAIKLGNELIDLFTTNKAITGIPGKFTPDFLQTEVGQVVSSKLNELVLVKSQLGKGVPTRLRLQLERLSKPDTWQNPKAALRLLKDIVNDPENVKDAQEAEALEQILIENPDKQPQNIKSVVKKRVHEAKKTAKQNTFDELPPASQYDGKIATNPSTGEKLKSVNGQWIPLGGSNA